MLALHSLFFSTLCWSNIEDVEEGHKKHKSYNIGTEIIKLTKEHQFQMLRWIHVHLCKRFHNATLIKCSFLRN